MEETQFIDITGIDKATLLAALWNNAFTTLADASGPSEMTVDVAQDLFNSTGCYIGEFYGRSLKVYLSGDTFDCSEYERLNVGTQGTPFVQALVDVLRADPTNIRHRIFWTPDMPGLNSDSMSGSGPVFR